MKLHVYSQDRAIDEHHDVNADTVLIGRNEKKCQVLLPKERKDISREHVRLLRGLVVDDRGSRNGTFVDGVKIDEAKLITGRSFQIGDPTTNNLVTIEVLAEAVPALTSDRTQVDPIQPESAANSSDTLRVEAAEEVERWRSKCTELERTVERLGRELEAARADTKRSSALEELKTENRGLQQRLNSLKKEIETREREAHENVHAQLALRDLETVRARAEAAETELAGLRAQAEKLVPELDGAKARLRELEARYKAVDADLAKARAELATARRAEAGLLEAQEQNRRLCDELAQARAVKPEAAPKGLASVMVDKLQKQVNELKLENEQLRAGRPGASARPPELFHDLSSQVDRLRRDNEEMRTRQSAMQAENDGLRRSLFDAQKQLRQAPSRPAEPAGRKATPTSAFLRHLISEDPQDHLYGAQVPADEFLITEQFVCFRKVEKVVTRIAGELKQLISADTVIPGTDGANFRRLAQAVLETPGEDGARQAMCAYMDEFGKWFGISTLAYRRASTRMIEDVKKNLSEQGLTKNRPLGSLAIGKLAQAELWARSQQYLKELSQSSIESRIEELARKEAENLQLGTSPDQLPQS